MGISEPSPGPEAIRSPERYRVSQEASVAEVVERIDSGGEGLALVISDAGRLVATITDGDVRRAFLAGVQLSDSVRELMAKGKAIPYDQGPLTAPVGLSDDEMLRLMAENTLRHLPLINEQGQIIEVVMLRELAEERISPLRALVMAGGLGTRMMPLTKDTPKPMLPVGDRPLMERILRQLSSAGINRVNIALHYLPERITDHFGDGSRWGLDLDYVTEDQPLGTAGVLRLMDHSEEPLLVVNGDILTGVDFRAMVRYHHDHRADLTVAVRRYEVGMPYGVIDCEGALVTGIDEKPQQSYLVNAGIYLLQPSLIPHVPDSGHFDMTDLIKAALAQGDTVVAFLVHEYWLDIGRLDDYQLAQEHIRRGLINDVE